MPTRLYLDTARLGRMSMPSQRAHLDFARLASEEGCTLYWERFLRHGYDAWPNDMRLRYAGLATWHGLEYLRRSLAALADTSVAGSRVLLAHRSSRLMQLAVRVLFTRCRRVLTTDLTWPAYAELLLRESLLQGRKLIVVPLRRDVFFLKISVSTLIEKLTATYAETGADGLCLPAISHDGVRLPIRAIYRSINRRAVPRFAVIDGSQAICQAPVCLLGNWCDVYVAGSHKWLGAHIPLAFAVLGGQTANRAVADFVLHTTSRDEDDDPLLRFTSRLPSGSSGRFSETVNLAPLFTCAASAAQWCSRTHAIAHAFRRRLANAAQLCDLADRLDWPPVNTAPALRSAVVLLRPRARHLRSLSPHCMRAQFHRRGIAITAYTGGLVRLSMPQVLWQPWELDCIANALVALNSTDPNDPHQLLQPRRLLTTN